MTAWEVAGWIAFWWVVIDCGIVLLGWLAGHRLRRLEKDWNR